MSRVSQYVAYLNAEKAPTADEIRFFYTDLTITDALKKERHNYRLKLNKDKKNK